MQDLINNVKEESRIMVSQYLYGKCILSNQQEL